MTHRMIEDFTRTTKEHDLAMEVACVRASEEDLAKIWTDLQREAEAEQREFDHEDFDYYLDGFEQDYFAAAEEYFPEDPIIYFPFTLGA